MHNIEVLAQQLSLDPYFQRLEKMCSECMSNKTSQWGYDEEDNLICKKCWDRKYYLKHKITILDNTKQYHRTHREYRLEQIRQRNRNLRITLMEYLGGVKCIECNCNDYGKLQFHHINGDGEEDRKRFDSRARKMVSYYIKHIDEAKLKLQVLCSDCNTKNYLGIRKS